MAEQMYLEIQTAKSNAGCSSAARCDQLHAALASALDEMRTVGCSLFIAALLGFVTVPTCTAAQSSGPQAILGSLITSGRLPELRWPDFTEYRTEADEFYRPTGFAFAWIRQSKPTRQALDLIAAFRSADQQGLRPEDYEGPRWAGRLQALDKEALSGQASAAIDGDRARFDMAVTICAMRYVSHLHSGRVHPSQLHYNLDIGQTTYDLSEFLRRRLVDSPDVNAVLRTVEPPFPAYRRTVQALAEYRALMMRNADEPQGVLKVPEKSVKPGETYPEHSQLARKLEMLGDLPSETNDSGDIYQGAIVGAVKSFQRRHGLETDGRLGRATVNALNVPLAQRVLQLELALERWRWLPHEFTQPPVIVNIPEFEVHAYSRELQPQLSMRVVVGKAYHHQTPVFASYMKFIIFRPPWNVPLSIARAELVPAAKQKPDTFIKGNYEIVDVRGKVMSDGAADPAMLAEIRSGKLALRQRPGPKNSLGLIKFEFPNEFDVYMHGTPATSLFARSRRDFSHGCIRVEDPVALAEWVLRNRPEWTREKIVAAMNGDQTLRVTLKEPIPVLILYSTAGVMEDGEVRFYEDIYKHDQALERALSEYEPTP